MSHGLRNVPDRGFDVYVQLGAGLCHLETWPTLLAASVRAREIYEARALVTVVKAGTATVYTVPEAGWSVYGNTVRGA